MKTIIPRFGVVILFGALFVTRILFAQGTVFTYQGRLNDSGNPIGGQVDKS